MLVAAQSSLQQVHVDARSFMGELLNSVHEVGFVGNYWHTAVGAVDHVPVKNEDLLVLLVIPRDEMPVSAGRCVVPPGDPSHSFVVQVRSEGLRFWLQKHSLWNLVKFAKMLDASTIEEQAAISSLLGIEHLEWPKGWS